MNKILRYSFLAICLGFILSSFSVNDAKAQDVLGEILRRMDKHNAALQSLKADVTMVKYDAGLKITDPPMIGRTQYLAKSKHAKNKRWVRIDWTNPNEHMSLIGNDYVLYRPNLPQVIKGTVQNSKGGSKISNALAFINMSKAELKANYSVVYLGEEQIKGGTATWHLQLNPIKPVGYKMTELWIDKDGMPLQIKTIEPNNDWTAVLLFNIEKNQSMNLKSFEITYPKTIKPTPV